MEIESKIALKVAEHGFDAINFVDDWGNKKDLMMSPKLWIEIFKPDTVNNLS